MVILSAVYFPQPLLFPQPLSFGDLLVAALWNGAHVILDPFTLQSVSLIPDAIAGESPFKLLGCLT